MRNLLALFGKSPFGPLAEHTEKVHEAVTLVRPLFEAFLDGRWDETTRIYKQISDIEHQADEIKNGIRDHLPKSMFLPVDRGDMLLFLKEQDAIADGAEDLGVLLTMRRTPAPPALRNDILAFVDQIIRTSEVWYAAVKELPTLQEASFVGPEVNRTMDRIRDVSDQERIADDLQAALTRQLFDHEDELGAVSIFFWMHVFRVLGSIANHAENSADLLRLMLARR